MAYKGVLFDLERTILTTGNGFEDAEIDAFRAMGVELTEEDFIRMHSIGPKAGLEEWSGRLPTDRHEELHRTRRRLALEYLEQRSSLYEDTRPTIDRLNALNKVNGIVTSARQIHIASMNVRTQVSSLVPVLASREDVGERTKPDPYGLSIACRKLGHDPEDVLYVCDAAYDAIAAARLRMHSCFIQRPEMRDEEIRLTATHATYHVRSLHEVIELV